MFLFKKKKTTINVPLWDFAEIRKKKHPSSDLTLLLIYSYK